MGCSCSSGLLFILPLDANSDGPPYRWWRARSAVAKLRTIPGFTPSAESHAPAVAGRADQHRANDPGGTRWAGLLDRAVNIVLG